MNIVERKLRSEKKNWFLKHHPNTIGKWWEWPFYYQILYIKMLSPEASVFQWWCHLFQIRLHDQIFTHHHDLQYQTKYDAKFTRLFHLISNIKKNIGASNWSEHENSKCWTTHEQRFVLPAKQNLKPPEPPT